MSQNLRWIAPVPPEPHHDLMEAHQFTRRFYQEVHHREKFDRYCQWYYATAAQNQQEHRKLQSDFNFMGWFCRGRSSN